jgi:hypothetical protein
MPNVEFHLAQLRHAFTQLNADTVINQKDFAKGLLAPAITHFENEESLWRFWNEKAQTLAEENMRLRLTLGFVATWAWREDPPNANNRLTDDVRLSAIKYHPIVKDTWETDKAKAADPDLQTAFDTLTSWLLNNTEQVFEEEPEIDAARTAIAERMVKMTDIFVFGSNLAGRHGAGAALYAAKNRGAIYGQGIGLQGTSYGIPTKDRQIETLPLSEIRRHVNDFIVFAKSRPDLTFDITPIGCGLAGYKRAQIKPMFEGMPANCRFNKTWEDPDL